MARLLYWLAYSQSFPRNALFHATGLDRTHNLVVGGYRQGPWGESGCRQTLPAHCKQCDLKLHESVTCEDSEVVQADGRQVSVAWGHNMAVVVMECWLCGFLS